MRIRKINFQEINFEYRSYPQSMYDSVRRIGLSFPVKVDIIVSHDLKTPLTSIISYIDLLKNEEGYEKRRDVPYIIYNDGSSRSNDCWRDRNMH